MSAQYAASFSVKGYANQVLVQKLRTNLLGLEQFEQIYSLASWIRRLFSRVLDKPRSRRKPTLRQTDVHTQPVLETQQPGERTVSHHSKNPVQIFGHNSSFLDYPPALPADPSAFYMDAAANSLLHLSSSPTANYSQSEVSTFDGFGASLSAQGSGESFNLPPTPISQVDLLLQGLPEEESDNLAQIHSQSQDLRPSPLSASFEYENLLLLGFGRELSHEFPFNL